MVEVQKAQDGLLAGQKSAYERLGDLADRIATDQKLALALEARLARLAAHDHALLSTNQPTDRPVRTDVVTVLERTKVRPATNVEQLQALSNGQHIVLRARRVGSETLRITRTY